MQYAKYEKTKTLVLISSMMTYYNSAGPEEKKSIGRYNQYIALEKIALSQSCLINPLLSCKVICAGLLYGLGEDSTGMFYKRLRESYTGEKESIKILNQGNNVLPMVHVLDCAEYIREVVQT